MRRRRHVPVLFGALLLFAGVTCTDGPTSPRAGALQARVGLAPMFSATATEIFRGLTSFGLELDNVHIHLKYRDGRTAKDTTIALSAERDSLVIALAVAVSGREEVLKALVELRDGELVLFSGSQDVVASVGSSLVSRSPAIVVNYVGPGADATTLTIAPKDSVVFTTDSLQLTALALNESGASVSTIAVAWSIKDPLIGTLTSTGLFKPNPLRGETYVFGRLPTGLQDSARVEVVPVPAQIVLVSGDAQSGVVGSLLAQPIVVEALAADNLPVPGFEVEFEVIGGSGLLSTQTAVTDALGRASATLTLGTVVGTNTVSVALDGGPAVTVAATARAGSVADLVAASTSALATTVMAGANVSSALLPGVIAKDKFGNVVAGVGVRFRDHGNGLLNGLTDTLVTVNTGTTGKASLTSRRVRTLVGRDTVFATAAGVNDTVKFVATVTNALLDQLAFLQQPLGSTGGIPLAPVVVELLDEFGNRVISGVDATAQVTLNLLGSVTGAVLGGVKTVAATAGLATFNVSVNKAATAVYSLMATAVPAITADTSDIFDIAVGPVADLVAIGGETVGALPGEVLSLTLRAVDAGSNPVADSSVTVAVTSGGGLLNGVSGPVNLFTDAQGLVNVDWTMGSLQQLVTATVGSIQQQVSAVIAEKTAVVGEPSLTPKSAQPLSPQPKVQLVDNLGNPVLRAAITIGAGLIPATPTVGELTLSGDTTAITDALGVATFSNLTLTGDVEQQGQLRFFRLDDVTGLEDTRISPVQSSAIALLPGLPTQFIAQSTDDQRTAAGGTLPISVLATDGFNNVPGASVAFDFVAGASDCVLGATSVVTDALGMATIDVRAAKSLSSCVVRAQLAALPEVNQRVYFAPNTAAVWRGKTDNVWTEATNWLGTPRPDATTPVFIPDASAFETFNVPVLPATPIDLPWVVIGPGASLDLNRQTLTVADSIYADGPVFGNGVVTLWPNSSGKVRGQIRSLLRVGPTTGCNGTHFTVSGALVADSVEINCKMTLDQNLAMTVAGAFRTNGQGTLEQRTGQITVGGNATFAGGTSTFSDGILNLLGNVDYPGTLVSAFNAVTPHVTRLSGPGSQALVWNPLDLVTRFGIVEIDNVNGVTFGTPLLTVIAMNVEDLYVLDGSKLNVNGVLGLSGIPISGARLFVRPGATVVLDLLSSLTFPTCVVDGVISGGILDLGCQ